MIQLEKAADMSILEGTACLLRPLQMLIHY
jgi:hypothetical protein